MNPESSNEKIEFWHSWYVLIASMFSLLFFLLNKNLLLNIPLLGMMLFFYFKNGLKFISFSKILLFSVSSGLIFLFLLLLYPNVHYRDRVIGQWFGIILYQGAFDRGFFIMGRIVFIATLSMCSGLVINYTKVFLHLMIHKGLKLVLGYPILLALNSIALFKNEMDRLRIIAKQREINFKDRMGFFFPLLVFAIRHSQRGSFALVTRGLNEEKSFYFGYELSIRDRFFLLCFFLLYFILISIIFFY